MNQRGYAIAFGLVLLAVCLGAFFGGRFIYERVTGGTPANTWTPPETPVTELTAEPTAPAVAQALATTAGPTATASPRPLPTLRAILTPFVPPTATFAPTDTPAPPTATSTPQVITATATSALSGNFQFDLAAPVRATSDDCSGNLILGRVVDRNGTPMPGVRLHLTDEYGAENTIKETKAEQVDLGRYDFPLSGPGRRYYVVMEDAAGQPISEKVEIEHGVGPTPKASCHWVDWKQR